MKNMKEFERALKAVANLRRLAIIKFLKKEGEANVQEIATHLSLSFKATSRHLRILFSADILEKEQKNIYVYYRLAKDRLPVLKSLLDAL